MVLRGNGFCPGHITGFFTIHDSGVDPLLKGSRGAGVNLSKGAFSMVTLRPPESDSDIPLDLKIDLRGVDEFRIDEGIYKNVLTSLLPDSGKGWKASLKVRLQLPVGQGFGMSGAGCLSAAIAVWEAVHSDVPGWDRKLRFKAQQERFFSMNTDEFESGRISKKKKRSPLDIYLGEKEEKGPVKSSGKASGMLEEGGSVKAAKRWLEKSQADDEVRDVLYSDCISAAHRADLKAGGGLGDVVAQARGGIEMRLAPGIPPHGEVHTIPVGLDDTPSIALMIVGDPIDTSSVLSSKMRRERINQFGEEALANLLEDPSMERMMDESYRFSVSSRLQGLEVKGPLMEVGRIARASQVMLGNSVFAFVGGGLGAKQRTTVIDKWSRYGKVEICEIDLMGARPMN